MLGDAFWNPTRAKNFVVAMGGKPTTWRENLAFLAAKGGITVEQFRLLDPISYAYLVMPWGTHTEVGAKVKSILGEDNYRNLAWFYIHQSEVAAIRIRTSWRMSPTEVYEAFHWYEVGVKSGTRYYDTKKGRRSLVDATLDATKSELKSKRPATMRASNRLTLCWMPRLVG
jgi:hypothetical protein